MNRDPRRLPKPATPTSGKPVDGRSGAGVPVGLANEPVAGVLRTTRPVASGLAPTFQATRLALPPRWDAMGEDERLLIADGTRFLTMERRSSVMAGDFCRRKGAHRRWRAISDAGMALIGRPKTLQGLRILRFPAISSGRRDDLSARNPVDQNFVIKTCAS